MPQIDEEKEAKKKERARLILAGHSFTEDDDPFEGLTPQVRLAEHICDKDTFIASRVVADVRECCILDTAQC